jgi:hypothetical protein
MTFEVSSALQDYCLIQYISPNTVREHDHLGGFDPSFENSILQSFAPGTTVYTEYLLDDTVKCKYPNLTLKFDAKLMIRQNHFVTFKNYATQLGNTVASQRVNFLCCFNLSGHVGRIWLVSWLHELGWFDDNFCSKHFKILDSQPLRELYSKYIGNDYDTAIRQTAREHGSSKIIKFGNDSEMHLRHIDNLPVLEDKNKKSFVNLVSETMPTNVVPFPTEKFLYPIVYKTLWVAYAAPGYHAFVYEKLGFRKYQCFDYSFDQETDPIERLGKITHMLTKFSKMLPAEWEQIYDQEKETIKFNFEHVASGAFIRQLEQFNQVK